MKATATTQNKINNNKLKVKKAELKSQLDSFLSKLDDRSIEAVWIVSSDHKYDKTMRKPLNKSQLAESLISFALHEYQLDMEFLTEQEAMFAINYVIIKTSLMLSEIRIRS